MEDAINAYLRRAKQDTNPRIVRALFQDGTPDNHWYYRSNQVVSTSAVFLIDGRLTDDEFGPYEGPLNLMPDIVREHFLESRCEIDAELTKLATIAMNLY